VSGRKWPRLPTPEGNLLASGVASPDGNDAWTASVGFHGQEGTNFCFWRRVREARIDWFCNPCTQGGKLDVIVRTQAKLGFTGFIIVLLWLLVFNGSSENAMDVGGGGSGESPKDHSEVRGGPNLRASRRTGPGCAICRYSMMMLVSTMLHSPSTSSGNLQRPAIYASPPPSGAATGSAGQ